MKYEVVYTTTLGELESEVALLLADGWSLQGGVSVSYKRTNAYMVHERFAQAMTKELQDTNNDDV